MAKTLYPTIANAGAMSEFIGAFDIPSKVTDYLYRCQFSHCFNGIATRHSDTMDCKFVVDGKGVLLDLAETKELSALGQAWKERLKYVSAQAKDSKGLTAVLVRPDGFVAWATESEPDVSAAAQSIKCWFRAAL